MGSTDIGMPDIDTSQKERTLERSDKGNGLAKQTPSSSKSPMETTPRWLRKEVMARHKRKLYCIEEEGTR